MNDKTGKKDTNDKIVIQIPIEWDWSTELETQYVNHLRVTHAGPEFYVYFGELAMPGTLAEEGIPEKLTIIPKVRLAITAKQMEAFIKTLQSNYENFSNRNTEEIK